MKKRSTNATTKPSTGGAAGGGAPTTSSSSTLQRSQLEQLEQQQQHHPVHHVALNALPPIADHLDPSFLDTIPEDTSVAAGGIVRPALSTASAVASSSSNDEDINKTTEEDEDEEEANNNNNNNKKRRPGSDISGTGAALGEEEIGSHSSSSGRQQRQRRHAAKAEAIRRRRTLIFYGLVGILVAAVAVGIIIVVVQNSNNNTSSSSGSSNDNDDSINNTPAAAPVDTFAPGIFNDFWESESPTLQIVWEEQDIQELDIALLEITTNHTALFMESTKEDIDDGNNNNNNNDSSLQLPPEAACRRWFLNKPFHYGITVAKVGTERVQQRYILCLLYHTAGGLLDNGGGWTVTRSSEVDSVTGLTKTTFLSDAHHECAWDGITCIPLDETNQNGSEKQQQLNDDDSDESPPFVVAAIDLSTSNLIGTLPDELVHLKYIKYLRITDNPGLSGTIPTELFTKMTSLTACYLSNNSFTGSIPMPPSSSSSSISNSIPLKYLDLHKNQLTGKIPFFGSTLETLWVQYNLLNELPFDEYATKAISLVELLAYNNLLMGPFATESSPNWTIQNLQFVDLANNQLTGSLPESLLQLPLVTDVHFDFNALSGTLPATTTTSLQQSSGVSSSSLETLWLDSNQFTGTIPSTFGMEWVNLRSLFLQKNPDLRGIISTNHCSQWKNLQELKMDCNLPTITCNCCTECFG